MDLGYQYTAYVWPMLASAAWVLALAAYAWRYPTTPGALPFAAAMLFVAVWAAGSAAEVSAVSLLNKVAWFMFQRAVTLPASIAILCFALEYAGWGRWLTLRSLALLFAPAAVAIPLFVTNDSNHLTWTRFWLQGSVRSDVGPAGSLLLAYAAILLVLTMAVFVILFIRSPRHRWPVAGILLGQILVRVAYAAENTDIVVIPISLTVLAFDLVSLAYAFALFRFHFFRVVPVGREAVIERMDDGMLVLDADGRIADANPAVTRLLAMPRSRLIGRDAAQALAALPGPPLLAGSPATTQTELVLGTGQDARCYLVSSLPLTGRRGFYLGRLLALRDITAVKRAQDELLQQQKALATLQERDRIARELHDNLGQILGFVKMQAQAARSALARDQKSTADEYLAQLAAVVQDAHADVREYILGARSGAPSSAGFFADLAQYLQRYSQSYGVAAELIVPPELSDQSLEPAAQAQLLRIIQEALTNVRKHAQAHRARVVFRACDGRAEATVQDDGVGFDPTLLDREGGAHYGLHFMRERAQEVGGTVDIDTAPGLGTRVSISVPIRREQA